MARFSITIADGPEGQLHLEGRFDPPVETEDPHGITEAQRAGLMILAMFNPSSPEPQPGGDDDERVV